MDKRGLRRISLSEEDKFTLFIPAFSKSLELLDVTSAGASFKISEADFLKHPFVVGENLKACDVKINDRSVGEPQEAVICFVGKPIESYRPIGVRFVTFHDRAASSGHEGRSAERWSLPESFWPSGSFENPAVLNNIVHFRVKNISRTGGLLVLSARNRVLFRGTKISDAHLMLPTIGETKISFKVNWIRKVAGKDQVEMGISFVAKEAQLDPKLVSYLLAFGVSDNQEKLKKIVSLAGKIKKVKTLFEYGLVQTEEDYREVLKLRWLSYRRAGKVSDQATAEDMADQYDSHSKIVIAKMGSVVVGSVRYTYCSAPGHHFELDESIEIPGHYDRSQTLEASRACVTEEFENSDLIHGLFEYGTQVAVKCGAQWIISSCEKKLLPLYAKLGMFPQDIEFNLKTLDNIPHTFIVGDAKTIHTSHKLNPIVWHYTYSNVAHYLQRWGYVKKVKLSFPKKVIRDLGLFVIRRWPK